MTESVVLPSRFMQLDEVTSELRLSAATIYRGVRAKTFPAPAKFGPGRSVWVRSEVEGWIANRLAARSGEGAADWRRAFEPLDGKISF